jgi:hypothetical protein
VIYHVIEGCIADVKLGGDNGPAVSGRNHGRLLSRRRLTPTARSTFMENQKWQTL